jgi:hypothetical protein
VESAQVIVRQKMDGVHQTMAKSKPRKKYDPNRALMRIVSARKQTADAKSLKEDQLTDLAIVFRLSFSEMLNGRGTDHNWATCATALNVSAVLSNRGLGDEYSDLIDAAQRGLNRSKERQKRTGKWALDGEAIKAMQEALDLHESQIKIATKGELSSAIDEIHRMIDSGEIVEAA